MTLKGGLWFYGLKAVHASLYAFVLTLTQTHISQTFSNHLPPKRFWDWQRVQVSC